METTSKAMGLADLVAEAIGGAHFARGERHYGEERQQNCSAVRSADWARELHRGNSTKVNRTVRIRMSMILLEPAYMILHTSVKFKRRTISAIPHCGQYGSRR
jgi:hypothetical protein